MKRSLLSTLSLLLIAIGVFAQAPTLSWDRFYNGPVNASDKVTDMEISSTGDAYVTGYSDSTSNRDIVTIKYNAAGQQVWKKRYFLNSTSAEQANAIDLDETNNAIYVAGKADTIGRNTDFIIIKYNATTGQQLWVRYLDLGNNNADEAVDLETDPQGNIWVAGHGYSPANALGRDFALRKFDQYGALYTSPNEWTWSDSYPYTGDYYAEDLHIAYGNVYCTFSKFLSNGTNSQIGLLGFNLTTGSNVMGYPYYRPIGGGGNSVSPGAIRSYITHDVNNPYIYTAATDYSNSTYKYQVQKFNTALNTSWNYITYPSSSPSGDYFPTGIIVDRNTGDAYVTGYGDVDASPSINNNIVTIKVSGTDGSLLWATPPSFDGGGPFFGQPLLLLMGEQTRMIEVLRSNSAKILKGLWWPDIRPIATTLPISY